MTPDTQAAPAGARNATLADLAALLRDQQTRKVDIVATATAITARAGSSSWTRQPRNSAPTASP